MPVGRWVLASAMTLIGLAACTTSGTPSSTKNEPISGKAATDPQTGDPTDPAAIAAKLAEKPWEVISNKGETYLPNVFYADAAENEQIMPYAIDGHVQIDRLIYPTLGNPNLYAKSDVDDELVVVLRIEDSAISFLKPQLEPVAGSALQELVIPNDPNSGFGFFLVSRSARDANTTATSAISSGDGTGVSRIYPNDIYVNPEPDDEPAVFKKRHTVRFVFKQGAMKNVAAGLYDVRMELKQNNVLVTESTSEKPIYEYQYNAVDVLDTEPDEHSVINITDTQVSVGSEYGAKTKDKLDQLVQFINTTDDPAVRGASFITFNGDLHNGGSPGSLLQRTVATTYAQEAKSIVDILKFLPVPIFLTIGNHDGYVATGQVPEAVKIVDDAQLDSLEKVISDSAPLAWDQFQQTDYDAWLAKTASENRLGGEHEDLFAGGFARTSKIDGFAGWKEIPKADRNYILYDGFYQWRKTYGPLYYSHKFGKSFYISLNSYELRQHRRSGWGMYTVNYGGGMSDVQLDWLDRQLLRGTQDGSDVVVLAHHDPRGGHMGQDYGYYFDLIDFNSIYTSAINYLVGDVFNPIVCQLPEWALSAEKTDDCTHDGLQEWMRPDAEFDCSWDQRKPDFTCDASKGDPFASGIELMKLLAAHPQVRTVLLGHTHYNSMDVLQQGDDLVPAALPVDGASAQKFASLEVVNPIRGYAEASAASDSYDGNTVPLDPIEQSYNAYAQQYGRSISGWTRQTVAGAAGPRELLVLRLVSNADLANETYSGGKSAMGFSVLSLKTKSDARGVTYPQINHAKFFANNGNDSFVVVGETDIDRTKSLRPHDAANPLSNMFQW